jgi:hypothetical protein
MQVGIDLRLPEQLPPTFPLLSLDVLDLLTWCSILALLDLHVQDPHPHTFSLLSLTC